MSTLLDLFPNIKDTVTDLIQLNKSLGKVTLVGKINALDAAANLFEFTDRTSHLFDELKDELANALVEENVKNVLGELKGKSQIAIDILIRNLFERTADVGFLATDGVIVEFLLQETIPKDKMRQRLIEYAAKYTVYNEIVVFDVEGNVRVNMNTGNTIVSSDDPVIKQALDCNEYLEIHRHTDIFPSQARTLVYVQRIEYNGSAIGVLCLCFKLEDELHLIINNLSSERMRLSFADNTGMIATSKNTKKEKKQIRYSEDEYFIDDNHLMVTSKTNGYQGYTGIDDWFTYASDISHSDISVTKKETSEQKNNHNEHKNLLDKKLQMIIQKADDLVEDLRDVIINGEIIASKQRAYVLLPILEGIRTISTSLLSSIKESVRNLEYLVESSLINDAKLASHLALDIMDRNLYERANDCRWWALTPIFQSELPNGNFDQKRLNQMLLYINELYTVYTNLYLYDESGTIVAASNDHSIIGQKISNNVLTKVMRNQNTQYYFVSDFESTDLYEDRPTYIYNASIVHDKKNVGGIGIVFDAEVEFRAMLDDSFPRGKKGFSFFIDSKGAIISTSHPTSKPLDILKIDLIVLNDIGKHSVYKYLEFEEKSYIVSFAKSQGYREYKKTDNYKNIVYCVTFLEL